MAVYCILICFPVWQMQTNKQNKPQNLLISVITVNYKFNWVAFLLWTLIHIKFYYLGKFVKLSYMMGSYSVGVFLSVSTNGEHQNHFAFTR